jgi:hypothetical protein
MAVYQVLAVRLVSTNLVYSERNHQERQFPLLKRNADSIFHLSTRSDEWSVSET